ncbi:hypothetical protein Q7A53_05425 [Halobacillus rhizosphaerae]|uniref:hypothetical protein n=1 Tax=Halobacillus rhizosphaerae TaxID=3064889 RepID=UPI00398AF3F7
MDKKRKDLLMKLYAVAGIAETLKAGGTTSSLTPEELNKLSTVLTINVMNEYQSDLLNGHDPTFEDIDILLKSILNELLHDIENDGLLH